MVPTRTVVGLTSTHSTGSGIKLLERGWTLYFSGVAQGVRRQVGVGILISPRLSAAMLEFSPVNERLVQQLLSGKVPGVDEIRPEMLKALDLVGLLWLTRLFNVAWGSGTVASVWHTGVVVPIFKKGDRRVCSNYRGITLLSLPGKVYSRVLERRLRLIVEPQLQKEQCGFRPGRGTVDQLFTLAGLLGGGGGGESWKSLMTVSPRESCGGYCRSIGYWGRWYVPFDPCTNKVRSVSVFSAQSQARSQWVLDSAKVAHCHQFMDIISRRSRGEETVQFEDLRIPSLLFGDDVVLLATSYRDLQHALGQFAAECEAVGMRVSTSNSEAMVFCRKTENGAPSGLGVSCCLKRRTWCLVHE